VPAGRAHRQAAAPRRHIEASLSGCNALVLEANHDLDMLWNGMYPNC